MTPGTSLPPRVDPSLRWADVAQGLKGAARAAWARLGGFGRDVPRLGKALAALHLAALALLVTTAWQVPTIGAGGSGGHGLDGLHLAFLLVTGAGAAIMTLAGPVSGGTAGGRPAPAAGLGALMAQMSHELRTPLNAVIGFSELMARELYGPLGHVRYQEYAHHISESGGRLLRSSEDALAVTAAMTALMSERAPGRQERLRASTLVREAWTSAAAGSDGPRLAMTTCTACDIVAERRPTLQALQHLLREAVAQAPSDATVEVIGRRKGGSRLLEIRVREPRARPGGEEANASAGLNVILARLLLAAQATPADLTLQTTPHLWSAVLLFEPARPAA